MRRLMKAFDWLGAQGPILLMVSLMVGALAPACASVAQSALPFAAFLMILGSLVTAGLAPPEPQGGLPLLALLALGVAAGPCMAATLALTASGLEGDLALGVVLAVAGPPAASAAALATIFGLPPRFTFAMWIPSTLLCPLITPSLVAVFAGQTVDPAALAARLLAVVGSAALAAFVVVTLQRRTQGPKLSPLAASGMSVIGLTILGVAAAARVRVEMATDPASFVRLVVGALFLTAVLALVGAAVFAGLGRVRAAALSLVWGLRNQTIVWASFGATLPTEAERFLVAAALPILIVPLLVRLVRRFLMWRERHRLFACDAGSKGR